MDGARFLIVALDSKQTGLMDLIQSAFSMRLNYRSLTSIDKSVGENALV
jgi:hypothetical protein